MITIDGERLIVTTSSLRAVIDRGWLVSLMDRNTAAELVVPPTVEESALQLVYLNQPAVDVVGRLAANVSLHQLSPTSAQVRYGGWDADGVITFSVDEETGDLLVEPSAYSSRPGVHAVRWRLPAFRDGLELVAPFFQGVRLKPDDPLLAGRWDWPHRWEAGLAVLCGDDGGCWIHCRDNQFRYKALDIRDGRLGLETEAYGPIAASLGAGGLVWRLNVHQGDWQEPAGIYRDWLWSAYDLGARERKPWWDQIRLAVSWYGGDPDILEALAERIDPRAVLLHFSQWRTDAYDQNYPTFQASPTAREVIARGRAMGFHFLPHANAVDMDPTHEVYPLLRDFQYRDLAGRRLQGWGYDHASRQVLGVPNSYLSLSRNRARNVMVKIHPGLAMWRSVLCEEIRRGVDPLGCDGVFIDVTLCSWNLDNCLVENTTSTEGMMRLIDEVAALGDGLAVGGEGLNETTMQGQSFAQAHLFRSWQASTDGLSRCVGAAVGHYLFGRLCRTFGYSNLSGDTEESATRMWVHEKLGAIPTITVRSAEAIRRPNEAVRRQFELAGGRV